MDPARVNTIPPWHNPVNTTQLNHFLGFIGFISFILQAGIMLLTLDLNVRIMSRGVRGLSFDYSAETYYPQGWGLC